MIRQLLLAACLCTPAPALTPGATAAGPHALLAPNFEAAAMELVVLVAPTSFRAINPSDHALWLVFTDREVGSARCLPMPPRSGVESHFPRHALNGLSLCVLARTARGLEVSRTLELARLVAQGLIGFDSAADIEAPETGAVLPLFTLDSREGARALAAQREAVEAAGFAPTGPAHTPGVTPHGAKKEVPPKLEETLPPI